MLDPVRPTCAVILGLTAACMAGIAPANMAGAAASITPPAALYLRAGTVDTSKPLDATTLAAVIGTAAASQRMVVQLDGPITPERRARMQAAGIKVGDYLPVHAYIVDVSAAHATRVAGLEFIRWFSPYQDAWKLDPDLPVAGRPGRPFLTPERQEVVQRGNYNVVVSLFSNADIGAAGRSLWAIPGAVIRGEELVGDHLDLMIELPQNQIPALAQISGVQFVEPAPEVTTRNATTRWIVQSNVNNVTPLYAAGIRGEGQIVGVLDNGFDINHCSFRDASNNTPGANHRKVVYRTDGVGSHGTHVSGTAVGDAGNDSDTRGIAYMAKMAYSNWPSFTEVGMMNALAPHYNNGARMHTNSWGDDGTTAYNSLCRGIDRFQYENEESLIFFAVTNTSTLKNPENAKNLVAVGNVRDTPSQGQMNTGGTGPTADGRRKPEIWAPGTNTNSASSGTACSTNQSTGTSMASPAVAGVGALVRQYYTDGYYPGGLPNPGGGFSPSGALVKATIFNSGADLDAPGYPGVREGWGRVLIDNSLAFQNDTRKLVIQDVRNDQGLATNGVEEVGFTLTGSTEQLRVTLVWTEPPATAGASFASVNDLDLEVIAPDASLYLGNVFNTSLGVSITGGTKDDRNNVEQVHLNNPLPGVWTARIKGGNVAVGAQGYALVITGEVLPPDPAPLYLSLATPVPGLVGPGVSLDLDVRIIEGSQSYEPGSGRMHYRMAPSGAFVETPLIPQGGEIHRATLPAVACGNEPQFYFTAMSDGAVSISLPHNAPTNTFSTLVGTVQTTTVYEQDFAAGLPAGWSATGLWNVSAACAPSGSCAGGASPWAYYGQPSNCTFNTGAANAGTMTAAPITLPAIPPGGSIELTYCSAKISENNSSYDHSEVRINGVVVDSATESPDWEVRSVDLSTYAGQTVTLSFRFDTVDGVQNNFRGWHVDNIKITATTTTCEPACYANCDGSTLEPVLNIADFSCFISKFAAGDPYANCDGSTIEPVLNVADFACFLSSFAAGCR
jgi:hypothetical protein